MLEVDIAVRRGTFRLEVALACERVTAIMGANGSGKTTLLRAILGAVRPERGRIVLGGRTLFGGRIDVPVEERRVAYVPQGYGLFPHLSVRENVRFAIRGRDRDARASELCARFELEPFADRRPPSLSGGEAQRVALARALAAEPELLLLDEPLAALDAGARTKIRAFLTDWLDRTPVPTLLVTHDRDDARALAADVITLGN